ncbi:hypothetical protein, partial [Klebsiella pneumoniae]|uniref:hypothetical protein n=1 Tax=Klebsiella pneumoniae TaxID=573 RepID=UPI0019547E87
PAAPKEFVVPAQPPAAETVAKPRGAARGAASEPEEAGPKPEAEVKADSAPQGGAEVVSLDKFRKK